VLDLEGLMPKRAVPHMQRFYSSITMPAGPEGCWEWTGSKCRLGYGATSGSQELDGTRRPKAHRFAYARLVAPIPEGMVVRHKCDNRGCVNPDHLELGTQQDNIQDRVRRGRNGYPVRPRKLSPDIIAKVREAAAAGVFQRDIAKEFGVSQRTVVKIVHRLNGYARY
jgi:hypothetical protein